MYTRSLIGEIWGVKKFAILARRHRGQLLTEGAVTDILLSSYILGRVFKYAKVRPFSFV